MQPDYVAVNGLRNAIACGYVDYGLEYKFERYQHEFA